MEWKVVTVKLRDLKPWERNPRRMGKKAADRLLRSWEEFGQVQTIAIGPDGEVYDGHQRLSVLKAAYGDDYEVLALQASRPLTEEERERLVLLLHAGAVGGWDWNVLSGWSTEVLKDCGFDDLLETLKHDVVALTNLLADTDTLPSDDLRQWSEQIELKYTLRIVHLSAAEADALKHELRMRGYEVSVSREA